MSIIESALGASPPDPGSDRISGIRPVALREAADVAMDLSGVALAGDYLVLGADEGHQLQILLRGRDGAWGRDRMLTVAKEDQEVDIEAVTYGGGYLYVIGSHAHRRRRLKAELSVRKNLERLLEIEPQPARNRLVRLPFDPSSGAVGEAEQIDLSKRLKKDPLLRPFFGIPSKENGIDIEGIAYRDGELYLGFRGPVLRDNYVPVMVLEFERPKRYTLRFVRLDGQGIRDMVAVDDGFLVLSGPVNDAPGPYCLWWWDGVDQIPGKGREVRETAMLGAVSAPGGAKAEGLALLAQEGRQAEVLVVYDTRTSSQPVGMRVVLPG